MRWLIPIALVCGSLAGGQEAETPAAAPTFQSGISLIHVDAEVLEKDRVVSGLKKEDFRILDNDQPRPVVSFSQDREPLDVVLLLDLSGSMWSKLKKVAEAAAMALREFNSKDHVAVMIFGAYTVTVQPFTDDMDQVASAIRKAVMTKGADLGKWTKRTYLLASITEAAAYLQTQPRGERRRAIVMVSDNHGMVSAEPMLVKRALWETDAVLCGLQLRSLYEGPDMWQPETMDAEVDETGGEVLSGRDARNFHELLRRIRMRYSIYYAMPEGVPGEERRVQVMLAGAAGSLHPKAKVRARRGYQIPGDSAGARLN